MWCGINDPEVWVAQAIVQCLVVSKRAAGGGAGEFLFLSPADSVAPWPCYVQPVSPAVCRALTARLALPVQSRWTTYGGRFRRHRKPLNDEMCAVAFTRASLMF